MGNVNYIASAGTGKTYSLVEEVVNKIYEGIDLKNMLILTFTEKAAAELKKRIAKKIEEILKSEKDIQKIKIIYNQLIQLNSGYIGTFHSVFLRLLKKYPDISGIDGSYSVLSDEEKSFVEVAYEKWIEKDYKEDEKTWEEIVDIFKDKQYLLKNSIIELYNNRLKLNFYKSSSDLYLQKKLIEELSKKLENTLDIFIKIYPVISDLPLDSNLLNAHPKKEKRYTDFPDFKYIIKRRLTSANITEEEREYYKDNLNNLINSDEFKEDEKEIAELVSHLKKQALDYNANLILKKVFDFIDFIQLLKAENKFIDFNDIIQKTFQLIKNEDIKKEIKSHFKYIFIDEFQDTDEIQAKIIKEIADDNIYIFGDPKQCIYTWRDADLNAYLDFIKDNNFEDKTLSTSYRSCQNVVEFVNNLLEKEIILNHLDKKFKNPIKTNIKEKGKIEIIKFKGFKKSSRKMKREEIDFITEIEAHYIAKLIKNLVKDGYKYSDFMILFRNNSYIHKFKEIFLKYKIPMATPEGKNIFQTKEGKTVLNILKLIEFLKRKLELLKVLKSPLYLIDDKELYQLKDILDIDKLEDKNIQVIKHLIEIKNDLTVEEIIDRIYSDTDILESFSLIDENGQAIENLKKIKNLARAKSFESYSLRDFILFAETSEVPEAESLEENSVKLLTMHKAKGLESRVVILPVLSLELSENRLNNIHKDKGQLLLNLSKAKSIQLDEDLKNQLKEEIEYENERLLYVALTRAKERLIITFNEEKASGKAFSSYIEEAIKKSQEEQFEFYEVPINEIDKEIEFVERKDNIDISSILEGLKQLENKRRELYEQFINKKRFTSVSQIMEEDYKEEINYEFSKKEEENIGLYTGILVHEILEKLEFGDSKIFTMEKVEKLAEEFKNMVPENIREKVIENSIKIVENLQKSQFIDEIKDAKILFKELPFTLYENDIFIEGRIDLIYEKDGKVVVMDYKTNKYENEEEKENIIKAYEKQKDYYLKAVRKIFPDRDVIFKLALLYKGEVVD